MTFHICHLIQFDSILAANKTEKSCSHQIRTRIYHCSAANGAHSSHVSAPNDRISGTYEYCMNLLYADEQACARTEHTASPFEILSVTGDNYTTIVKIVALTYGIFSILCMIFE